MAASGTGAEEGKQQGGRATDASAGGSSTIESDSKLPGALSATVAVATFRAALAVDAKTEAELEAAEQGEPLLKEVQSYLEKITQAVLQQPGVSRNELFSALLPILQGSWSAARAERFVETCWGAATKAARRFATPAPAPSTKAAASSRGSLPSRTTRNTRETKASNSIAKTDGGGGLGKALLQAQEVLAELAAQELADEEAKAEQKVRKKRLKAEKRSQARAKKSAAAIPTEAPANSTGSSASPSSAAEKSEEELEKEKKNEKEKEEDGEVGRGGTMQLPARDDQKNDNSTGFPDSNINEDSNDETSKDKAEHAEEKGNDETASSHRGLNAEVTKLTPLQIGEADELCPNAPEPELAVGEASEQRFPVPSPPSAPSSSSAKLTDAPSEEQAGSARRPPPQPIFTDRNGRTTTKKGQRQRRGTPRTSSNEPLGQVLLEPRPRRRRGDLDHTLPSSPSASASSCAAAAAAEPTSFAAAAPASASAAATTATAAAAAVARLPRSLRRAHLGGGSSKALLEAQLSADSLAAASSGGSHGCKWTVKSYTQGTETTWDVAELPSGHIGSLRIVSRSVLKDSNPARRRGGREDPPAGAGSGGRHRRSALGDDQSSQPSLTLSLSSSTKETAPEQQSTTSWRRTLSGTATPLLIEEEAGTERCTHIELKEEEDEDLELSEAEDIDGESFASRGSVLSEHSPHSSSSTPSSSSSSSSSVAPSSSSASSSSSSLLPDGLASVLGPVHTGGKRQGQVPDARSTAPQGKAGLSSRRTPQSDPRELVKNPPDVKSEVDAATAQVQVAAVVAPSHDLDATGDASLPSALAPETAPASVAAAASAFAPLHDPLEPMTVPLPVRNLGDVSDVAHRRRLLSEPPGLGGWSPLLGCHEESVGGSSESAASLGAATVSAGMPPSHSRRRFMDPADPGFNFNFGGHVTSVPLSGPASSSIAQVGAGGFVGATAASRSAASPCLTGRPPKPVSKPSSPRSGAIRADEQRMGPQPGHSHSSAWHSAAPPQPPMMSRSLSAGSSTSQPPSIFGDSYQFPPSLVPGLHDMPLGLIPPGPATFPPPGIEVSRLPECLQMQTSSQSQSAGCCGRSASAGDDSGSLFSRQLSVESFADLDSTRTPAVLWPHTPERGASSPMTSFMLPPSMAQEIPHRLGSPLQHDLAPPATAASSGAAKASLSVDQTAVPRHVVYVPVMVPHRCSHCGQECQSCLPSAPWPAAPWPPWMVAPGAYLPPFCMPPQPTSSTAPACGTTAQTAVQATLGRVSEAAQTMAGELASFLAPVEGQDADNVEKVLPENSAGNSIPSPQQLQPRQS